MWTVPVLAVCLFTYAFGAEGCKKRTQSQPNPISSQYPSDATGTLNGTIAILLIEFSLARSIIPKKYAILENAYRQLLPSFPEGMYPAMLQANIDHDVRTGSITIPDFSRAGISFPFVDRLGDGYTCMTYGSNILISASNLVALGGAGAYGNIVSPATFDPPCDGYAAVHGSSTGETFFNAYAVPKGKNPPSIGTKFRPLGEGETSPYSIDFWKNVTNQPQFANNPLVCDNFIRLFNASVTLPPFAPTEVKGEVSAVKPYFAKTTTFSDVYGLRLDNAFIERNYKPCKSLKGYSGSGSGD